MRIALPVVQKNLSMHFGHCEEFALLDVDKDKKSIINIEYVPSPPHQPGMLPGWLAQKGVNIIIAGGMGSRAQGIFAYHGIQVVLGSPTGSPEQIVQDYLNGTLETGENVCDH